MDYEQDYDAHCPKCNHSPIHYRDCTEIMCNDGHLDLSDFDSINYYPGEQEFDCEECCGTGVEVWCPECGKNLSGLDVLSSDDDLL